MRYKVGDKVRIKSLGWYYANKDNQGKISIPFVLSPGHRVQNPKVIFSEAMAIECGTIMTIEHIIDGFYIMKGNKHGWTDKMIEGLVEEETKPKFKVGDRVITNKGYVGKFEGWVSDYQVRVLFEENGDNAVMHPKNLKLVEEEIKPKYEDEVNGEYYSTPKYLVRPSGYQFVDENGNVINATKIVLEKKPNYPKTFLGCCDVLNIGNLIERGVKGYKAELFDTLQKLLICRDAYWKIAGEEMGLSKPWEPDWEFDDTKYVLYFNKGEIVKEMMKHTSYILAFPTEEMQDAFYENFKVLIEECKELL